MIYMSAYLHDSAMAMPDWEYNVLRTVEGTEQLREWVKSGWVEKHKEKN